LRDYIWFCLEHVRAYNASWDFYAGMSQDEIEAAIRRDVTWQRPTWPLGGAGPRRRPYGPEDIHDPYGVFNGAEPEREYRERRRQSGDAELAEALSVMDLSLPTSIEELKARYKDLVKRHHPDANGGDGGDEELLKAINRAYTTLKRRLAA
jgi:hypothetical protein